MFNIFKKQNQDMPSQPQKYSTDIEQIHHEFEIAGETLLEEALNIINETKIVNEEKILRLKKAGFKNVGEVKTGDVLIQKKLMSENIANLIQYYQRAYPLNKFITEEQVKTICEKYNLVCGNISRYRGFVPDEKLKQIESFNLKRSDIEKYRMAVTDRSGKFVSHLGDNDLTDHGKKYMDANRNTKWCYLYVTDGTGKHSYSYRMINEECEARFAGQSYVKADLMENDMQICAPLKDMDTTGLEVNGYKLMKHIPDPVVLQPVRGGYLIVCAWGDEASDPIVSNPIEN